MEKTSVKTSVLTRHFHNPGIVYGLGLTTMSQTNLLKLDGVQNEAMRVILGTTKDTPTETMRFMLDLPPMQTRPKVKQVKSYFSAVENHPMKP